MNDNIWQSTDKKPKHDHRIIINYSMDMYRDNGWDENDNWDKFVVDNQVNKWCYLDDLISQSTRVEKLEKQLADTQSGLCCGHCNKTAEASIIWANRLAKLEKALDLAKEFIKDTLSPFVYKSLLEEITQTLDKTEINTITKGDNDE